MESVITEGFSVARHSHRFDLAKVDAFLEIVSYQSQLKIV